MSNIDIGDLCHWRLSHVHTVRSIGVLVSGRARFSSRVNRKAAIMAAYKKSNVVISLAALRFRNFQAVGTTLPAVLYAVSNHLMSTRHRAIFSGALARSVRILSGFHAYLYRGINSSPRSIRNVAVWMHATRSSSCA